MLHAILLFMTGAIFWLLVLNKFPFNQKGFEGLAPFRRKYFSYLKFFGSFFLIYSVFIASGLLV